MLKKSFYIIALSLLLFSSACKESLVTSTIEPTKIEGMADAFYRNPSGINEIGDPYIVKHNPDDEFYYLYATYKTDGAQSWKSKDLKNWEYLGYIYRIDKGSWAMDKLWGPKVHKNGSKYYLYYSARMRYDSLNLSGDPMKNRLMIGAAIGDNPLGPFVDIGRPLFDFGYAVIDNHVFIDDDGSKYFLYSRDCSTNINEGRHESHMYICRLADDMTTLVGTPRLLTKPDQSWWEFKSGEQWRWNEGSEMVKHDGRYYFMWSANYYATRDYSVGFAVGDNPMGPFIKSDLNPILQAYSDQDSIMVSGPGNNKVFQSPDNKEYWTTYHSHTYPGEDEQGWNRQMCIDRMGFRSDGSIYINGPTLSWQPVPSGVNGYYNIAPQATISTSSTRKNYSNKAIVDREIGMWEKYEQYEWLSNGQRNNAWVQLKWKEKRIVNAILIYDSAVPARKIRKGKIVFDEGEKISVTFDNIRGSAAIACFAPFLTGGFKFIVTEMVTPGDESVGLSEIMVLSKINTLE